MRSILVLWVFVYLSKSTVTSQSPLEVAVDLTWPFDNTSVYWKDSLPIVYIKKIRLMLKDGFSYAANDYCSGEHGGTHLDAPYHFNPAGWKVGDIPLQRLIAHGITIDLSEEAKWLGRETLLLPEHLIAWEQAFGPIPHNSVILVNFGYSQYYHNKTQFLGIDADNNFNFPGISGAAAEWIVRTGKVVGVGVDTASIDQGKSMDGPAHKTLCSNQIYLMESVRIPHGFPPRGYILFVMPMKLADGTGAPLRIIAVPQDDGYPYPQHLR